MIEDVEAAVARTHREEWSRVVGTMMRVFGDLDVAEDAAAEAFATAVERWRADGVPPNPGGWLTTTARRRAIDRLRREQRRAERHRAARALHADAEAVDGAIEDERLRLLLTCCHSVLPLEARVALTLRMVGGLTVPEVAAAFLVRETTMGQRISRAKSRLRSAGAPYRMPLEEDLPERLDGVLAVLYLIFNEGYLPSGSAHGGVRADLSTEATRLTRILHGLLPHRSEVDGLLALMLLTEARRAARIAPDGALVVLAEQDRGVWDPAMIAEGRRLVDGCFPGCGSPGRYAILAAIGAEHTAAARAVDTDWRRILRLYDLLIRVDPSPVVALNRAVAVAEVDGPGAALELVDGLAGPLAGYHAAAAVRADLLRRLGRTEEARAEYDRAIGLATNPAEQVHLARRRSGSA